MKKIFTLLFAVGMFTLAQAQPGSRDNRQTDQRDQNNGYDKQKDVVVYNNSYDKDNRYGNGNYSFERNRDMQIARINQEYDYKIQRVRNNFFMWRYEKERQIRLLQEQRQWEIRKVYGSFDDRRDRHNEYGDHDDHSNRHY